MADKFERHRLTRWVKADVPSYGDEWGNEYEDYEHNQHSEHGTNLSDEPLEPHGSHTHANTDIGPATRPNHVSNSTLVLSIDRSTFDVPLDDSDGLSTGPVSGTDTPPFVSAKSLPSAAPTSPYPPPNTLHIQHINTTTVETAVHATNTSTHLAAGLLPPTPTYQTRHQFVPASPDTDASDRSYMSDADSIQREPANLHVWAPVERSLGDSSTTNAPFPTRASEEFSSASMSTGERSFVELRKALQRVGAPQALVLSIDRLNLDASDEDEDDDDGDDDWGYNSNHSSNFDEQEPNLTVAPVQLPPQNLGVHTPRHRVKTDALDSLINDLSKMEDDAALFGGSSAQTLGSQQSVVESGNREYQAPKHTAGLLPTLDSIHDMQLPDFTSHSFNKEHDHDQYSGSDFIHRGGDTSSVLDDDHQKFVSSVRQDSVRKPPPVNLAHPTQSLQQFTQDPNAGDRSVTSIAEAPQETPKVEAGTVSTAITDQVFAPKSRAPDLVPPPSGRDCIDVGRRDSTISTSTFNLGTWKPNTSIYRDQFVNDNDNESHMNVSLYNKDESVYKKFTRMGPVSTYAPSITNSSCVSVPDTVETNLQQINEDRLDEEYPDTISVAKSYHPTTPLVSSDHSLGSSVLYDHEYEKPKFHEEPQTPAPSTDDLAPIHEETEPAATSAGSLGTMKTKSMADSDTSSTLPKKVKYPVSNWKKIMAISQPVDRIELLKKARIDEMNYDTGLSQWLRESLKSTESPHIQIGKLATQAYKNAQHSDIRRHTSIRSKVSLVRDRIEPGNLGMQASSLGRKFLSRGKKFIKQGTE